MVNSFYFHVLNYVNKSLSHYNPEDKKGRNGIDAKPSSFLHKPVLKEIIPSNTMRDEFPTNVTFKLSNYLWTHNKSQLL